MSGLGSPRPVRSAWRAPWAWAVFCGVFVAVLALDLGTKYWAFEAVGDRPVTLVRDWTQFEAWFAEGDHTRLVVLYDDPHFELASMPPVVAVPGVLHFKLHTNTGAVFGLGAGKRWVFVSVSIVAVFVLGWLFWQSPASAWMFHASLALVLAGAMGNLYDRLVYGAVRDMLHMLPGVHLPFGLRWPGQGGAPGSDEVWPWVFNLADVSLLAGVAGVMIGTWFGVAELPPKKVPPEPATAQPSPEEEATPGERSA